MQRIIKFRAWDTNDERMISWRELLDYGSGLADYLEHPRELIFQEYTGLKDKNGKEIYEGDILAREGFISWEVRWGIGGFEVVNLSISDTGYSFDDSTERMVVGNIYEP